MQAELDRTGLLILRVRLVADRPLRVPARLTATMTTSVDLSMRDAHEDTFGGSVDDVVVAVRRWVETFAAYATGDDAVTTM